MTDERWRAVRQCAGYEVSSFGRVRSLDRVVLTANGQQRKYRGTVFSPTHNGVGHQKVFLPIKPDHKRPFFVHTLVLEAFVGPRPSGHEAAHNDGNPRNNHLDNLRWSTPKENQADKVAHGTLLYGEKHPSHVLWAVDVEVVRARLARGDLQREIAKDLGVTRSNISAIAIGRSWRRAHSGGTRFYGRVP